MLLRPDGPVSNAWDSTTREWLALSAMGISMTPSISKACRRIIRHAEMRTCSRLASRPQGCNSRSLSPWPCAPWASGTQVRRDTTLSQTRWKRKSRSAGRIASSTNSLRRVIGRDLLLRAGTQERNQNVPGTRGRRRNHLRQKASIACAASTAFLLPSVHDSQAADGRHVDRRRCSERSEVA